MSNSLPPDPLVSITLPLAPDADTDLVRACLKSISGQTYPNLETVLYLSDGAGAALERLVEQFGPEKLARGTATKSAARNTLLGSAAGEFVLYVDHDMELSPNLVGQCVKLAGRLHSDAIITRQREAPSPNFWSRCRALEWELLEADIGAGSPYFLKTSAISTLGGFDEALDMWDDWGMTLKIMAAEFRIDRVSETIWIHDTTNLVEMFVRKYRRGRYIPLLLERFPDAPQTRFGERFIRIYVRNWRALVQSPILSTGLMLLKLIDSAGLFIGRMHPIRHSHSDGTRRYFEGETASAYDAVRLGNAYNRYKHRSELRGLGELIRGNNHEMAEIGSGTGRITSALTRKGFKVTPVDPSPAMLRELRLNPDLQTPIRADGRQLPFSDAAFTGVVSVRVIWHLPSRTDFARMLQEMSRVSSEFVITDISNEVRWRHPLYRALAATYFLFNPSERRYHATTHLISLEDFLALAEACGLRDDGTYALDMLTPTWLRLVPPGIASALVPWLLRMEQFIANYAPPGRYFVRLVKRHDEQPASSAADEGLDY